MDNNIQQYQNPSQQYQNPAATQQLQQQQSDYQKTLQKRQAQHQESDNIFHGILQQLQDLEMNGIDTAQIGNAINQAHHQSQIHSLAQQANQAKLQPQQQTNPLSQILQGAKQAFSGAGSMVGGALRSVPQVASAGWQDFVNMATQIAKQRNFPAGVLLGQAALESARGAAAPGNNFFGIKGSGTAGSNVLPTKEYAPGKGYYGENSGFAAYKTPQDAINAYLDLVQNQYGVKTTDPKQALQQIEQHGYATSPTYVQNVMNTPEFQQAAMPAIAGQTIGEMQAAAQQARGMGLLADFDKAINAGDHGEAQGVAQRIFQDPKYQQYWPSIYSAVKTFLSAPSSTLDAMPLIAPLGPYQQLLQSQQRGGVNQ
jgi:flagellum-specific peptidoglycan hydrolase FlgJ